LGKDEVDESKKCGGYCTGDLKSKEQEEREKQQIINLLLTKAGFSTWEDAEQALKAENE
jgi:hypothetical protein